MTADHILYRDTFDLAKAGSPKLPVLIIAGCVFFNFFLCYANTSGFPVSEKTVILSELMLVSLAAARGFFRPDRQRYFWLFILIAQFVYLALLSVIRDELLVRAFRDVMIMPVFIILGLASAKVNFAKPLLWMSAIVLAVALFEAFFLQTYTEIFNVRDYYIAKGYDSTEFLYINEDVFVSGIRPGGRFFPIPFDIHRVSSVFLEPVSLGFYAFISGLFFIALRNHLSRWQRFFALFLTLLLIWLGDARMAFASLLLVLLFRPLLGYLDHRLSILIFPAALLFGVFIVQSGLFYLGGESLGARVLWTMEHLDTTKEINFFGLQSFENPMFDSGFLYLMSYQGFLGFLLYWLPPILFRKKFTPEARIYWFGASIFLAFGLMISSAIFTIKTAALLWFGYGYILSRTGHKEMERK